jgi:hypothetical protein
MYLEEKGFPITFAANMQTIKHTKRTKKQFSLAEGV